MRYALLIYHNEAASAQMSEAEQQALMGAYNAFTEEIRKRGVMQGGGGTTAHLDRDDGAGAG